MDSALTAAIRKATNIACAKRVEALAALPDAEGLRERASKIRVDVLTNLRSYLNKFTLEATKAGAEIHFAEDAEFARNIITGILKDRGVTTVVKSKSMITEEIELNDHLVREGIKPVETDLGEYHSTIGWRKAIPHHCPRHTYEPPIHRQALCERARGALFR